MIDFKALFRQAIEAKASDIHLQGGHAPILRVHGSLVRAGKEAGLRCMVIARRTRAEAVEAAERFRASAPVDYLVSQANYVDRSDSQMIRDAYARASDEWPAPWLWTGAVRTHGMLEISNISREVRPSLRGTFGSYILLYPVTEVQFEWEQEAKRWYGKEVEITGVFGQGADQSTMQVYYNLVFWAYLGPPDKELPKDVKSQLVSLEELLSRPGKYDNKVVHVVGKFRGQNLYGDLPARSQRNSGDWVIKDDLYAVWVSGRKPKGPGWELDASLKRDTGKWIEVVGRPETRNGVTYIKAMQVRITDPPRPTADAAPPPPPPERPKVPPVVVFALPLDGEGDVPSDSRFVVQFNKDMDEATFKDHVMLRYVGPVLPGDREFDGVKLSYDQGRRALTVDPGDVLRPGRQIELMLLPGISDLDGLTLVARPGKQFDGAADVLRFRVGT